MNDKYLASPSPHDKYKPPASASMGASQGPDAPVATDPKRAAVVQMAKRILTLRGDLAKKAMDGTFSGKDLILAAADVDAAEVELDRLLLAL